MTLISELKRNKSFYYISNFIQTNLPSSYFQSKLNSLLKKQKEYPQKLLEDRLRYYHNDFKDDQDLNDCITIRDLKKTKRGSVYYYDFLSIVRFFSPKFKVRYLFGDITETQEKPTFVKSRPIEENSKSILLKLNKIRHYRFIENDKHFDKKESKIVWRGVIHKQNRKLLVEKFHNHPLCNIGYTESRQKISVEKSNKLSIDKQLNYKFILSIEGVDVATNLKWIMSSNSL